MTTLDDIARLLREQIDATNRLCRVMAIHAVAVAPPAGAESIEVAAAGYARSFERFASFKSPSYDEDRT